MTDTSATEKTIFLEAVELAAPTERAAFLARACGENRQLRAAVEALLAAHGQEQELLDATAITHAERPGTQIGPYKLLQQIGEGGMGVVYMAEQTEPIARRVALKIIKPGMDSHQVIARFEAERQALAMMDHVNIARVLDAGTTPAGRPFFVMELVSGVPITKYCNDNQLTPRQRLELFVPVCQAIQHAHQKGIIHRDIKPSNVMVTLYDGQPVSKVIDFGVAKATEQKLTERTLFTQYGTMVGTLEYMSPEQAEMSGLGVDTRSDIFSLGVLLYELLTGSTPLSHKRLQEAAYDEVLRMIREEEAPKPSTRLSESGEALASISAQRHTEPAKLSKLMRGELDWIVMKCLEKDRNRRYETANGFAMDVQRYLADEPVLACPPSAGYRFRKFARRNKAALVMASVIGMALLLAVGSLGWMASDRAARQARTAGEVNQFLQRAESLYADNKLPEAVADIEKARGVLEAGSGDVDLGRRVRQWLTDLDTAAKLEEIRRESGMDHDREYADYARVFRDYGIDVEALPTEEATARVAASQIKLDLALALNGWASRLRFDPRPQDPARWQRLLAISRATDPDPWRLRLYAAVEAKDVQTLRELANGADPGRLRTRTLAHLGASLRTAGDTEAAVAFLRKVQRQHPGDFSINSNLAYCLKELKPPPWDEAIAFQRAALAVRPQTAGAHNNLGGFLHKQKKLDEAIACFRKAIELDPKQAIPYNGLGNALYDQRKLDEAIAAYRKAIELDPKKAHVCSILGNVLHEQGKLDEAIAAYRKAIDLDPKDSAAHYGLGIALQAQGKLDEAIAADRKLIELLPKYATAHFNLGVVLSEQKKLDEAVAAYRMAIELEPSFAKAYINLGLDLFAQKKLPEAIAAYNKAIEIDPKNAPVHFYLGLALRDQKKVDEAIAAYRQAIEVDPKYGQAYHLLGIALSEQGKWDEAIAIYRKRIEVDPKDAQAHITLGVTLNRQGKPEEAIAVYRQGLKRLPDKAGLHVSLANALWKQRRLEEAAASFRQAIQLLPPADKYYQYYYLGCVLNEQKKPQEAVDALCKSIDLNPKFALAHYQLGLALSALGQDANAIACYRKAIEVDPKNAQAYFSLGNALRAQGKLEDAIAAFRQAVSLVPNNAACWSTLGVTHYRAGNWKAAIEALEKSRQLSPYCSKDSVTLFLLSMAHGQLNENEQARTFYDQAAQWRMGIGVAEEELRRLCAEAAALLGRDVPPTLQEPPVLTPGPTLLKPTAGGTLDNGTFDHSKLMVWEFDWSDVPGATQYHLYVTAATGAVPVINNATLTSSAYRSESKAYFTEQYHPGRHWKVRALVQGIWTDWSEERTFEVAPLDDNQPDSPKK